MILPNGPHVVEIRLVIDLRVPGLDGVHRVDIPVTANLQQPSESVSRAEVIQVEQSALPPVLPTPAEAPAAANRNLAELLDELLGPRDDERRVADKTRKDNRSILNRFQAWLEASYGQNVNYLEVMQRPNVLRQYAEYLRAQPKGNSASMCVKALTTIGKLSSACVKAGLMKLKPEAPSKSAVNILKPRTERQRRIKAVPVTIDELKAMLAVVDGCKWPRLGNVSPATFWETSLLSHYCYGFRSQDWFACRTADKKGLLWSGVLDDTECPAVEGLHNAAGWCYYLVWKTAKKDEAAERPADVLVPLAPKIRELLEKFRGIDPVRVFPLANNSASYGHEFSALLDRAGLSDKARHEAGKPIIRLSLGQREVASFRKGSSAMWAKTVSRSASSYMLHHSVAEEGVAKMTTDSYLQNEDILRQITAKIETLPLW